MKIGIDIRLIGKKRTGDEVVFFNLVKNLARIDNKNEYCLFTDIVEEKILNKISNELGINQCENFKIIALKSQNKFSWNFWTLPRYLKKNPVDIYQTQYITPWFVSRKIKIVTIVHDISFNFFPQFIKFADLIFLKLLIPHSLKRADMIVAVSEFTRDEIIKYYKINSIKIEVIYNAVAEDFLHPSTGEEISTEERQIISQKYALSEDFLLYMGTLQPRKNIPFLIRGFVEINKKIPNLKLVIAGKRDAHNFDKKIEKEIVAYKIAEKIIFTGYIEDAEKRTLYAMAKAFVFPSLYEGFGIPVLEAMSQKVPVVASDIPSLKEIACNEALFFDANDENLVDFVNKVYTACEDKKVREKLIQAGLQRVSFFSWKKSAQKTLALYVKLFHN